MSASTYFGKGSTMVFRKVTDDRYESGDARYVVTKFKDDGIVWWAAWVGDPDKGFQLGVHKTKRQAIEHCKREA